MKRKMRAALLALMMVTALGTQAFAAQTARSYDFTFKPPYSGSWRKSSDCYNPVRGYKPYVSPKTTSARTVYYLLPKDVYDKGEVTPSATKFLTTGTYEKKITCVSADFTNDLSTGDSDFCRTNGQKL